LTNNKNNGTVTVTLARVKKMIYRLTKYIWEYDNFNDVKTELIEHCEALSAEQSRHIKRQEFKNLEKSIAFWTIHYGKRADHKAAYIERERIKSITPSADPKTLMATIAAIANYTERPKY
jgi:hypothetical protein